MGTNQSEYVDVRGPVSLLRWLFYLLRDSYNIWYEERTIRLGAGLAYYGIFAVVPLATLAVALAQVLFSQADVQQFLTEQMESIFGQQEATDIATKITEILDNGETTTSLGLIGIISLVIAASLVFVALQDALNVIWNQPKTHGLHSLVRRYGLAYLVVLLLGSLLVAGLVILLVEINGLIGPGAASQKPLTTVSGTIHGGLALTLVLFLLGLGLNS